MILSSHDQVHAGVDHVARDARDAGVGASDVPENSCKSEGCADAIDAGGDRQSHDGVIRYRGGSGGL